MPDPNAANPPQKAEETTETPDVLKDAGAQTQDKSVLGDADKENQEAAQAEEKRLLDTKDEALSEPDRAKKAEIVKAKEEKRLLDAKDEDLSETDKAKKQELLKAKELDKVPEKYEFKMPEGMELDKEMLDKVSPIFKDAKMSQGNAQKLVDIYIEKLKANETAQADAFKKFLKDSYDDTVKALGANYKQELAYVAKVKERFLSKDTQELLEASGLSNAKSFITDMIKIGKAIAEDRLEEGTHGADTDASPGKKLYPNQGKK